MRTTGNFVSTITKVNKIGRSYGFRNGIHWAEKAVRVNEIDRYLFAQFRKCSEMFVKLQGLSTGGLSVSDQLSMACQEFLHCISVSHLRNQQKQKPVLPTGTFRAYIKEFHWKGIDGEAYDFRFAIVNDGDGSSPSYRIYINSAPHLSDALDDLHRFHILGSDSNPYICWDSDITAFDKANAVMIVWAQNYKKELDKDKEQRGGGCSPPEKRTVPPAFPPEGDIQELRGIPGECGCRRGRCGGSGSCCRRGGFHLAEGCLSGAGCDEENHGHPWKKEAGAGRDARIH